MAARVIGIGQEMAGDDGVGIAVLEGLRTRTLPADTDLRIVAEPSALVSLLSGADPVIVVDAVLGGTPGEVLRLAPETLESSPVVPFSTHGIGVATALALARALSPAAMPQHLWIVGVGIPPPCKYVQALSASVTAAVPRAVAEVERLLGG